MPFNYLVPDERMLPAESGRFFRLDPVWVDCLLDGAFSIGRVTQTDYAQTQSQKESLTAGGSEDETITGLLLRSALVAGWPGLIVDAYDAQGAEVGPTISSDAWLNAETRIVDVDALASAIKEGAGIEKFTSAQFALQMIEGVTRVTLYARGVRASA